MWDCRGLERCGWSWIGVGLQGVGKVWMELDRCGTAGGWKGVDGVG